MPYQYTLIVSQYYFSRHLFVVRYDSKTFKDTAKAFALELMEYKRGGEERQREHVLGDLEDKHYRKESRRHNINDAGDIYFIHGETINCLEEDANKYEKEYINDLDFYDKRSKSYKKVCNDISKNHRHFTVRGIVANHFEIVG